MTIAEFKAAVKQIAGSRHHVVKVEVSEDISGHMDIAWAAYVMHHGRFGWTDDYRTPEEALAELRGETTQPFSVTEADVEAIGEVPNGE